MSAPATTPVYPKPGVTIYLPGGVHGFASGPVTMRADHAAALAPRLMTAEQKKAAEDLAKAEAEEKAAPKLG